MGFWSVALPFVSALVGGKGSRDQAKAAQQAAEASRYPEFTVDDLNYIQNEAQRLYEEGKWGGANPPPGYDLSGLEALQGSYDLPQQGGQAPAGGGQRTGGGKKSKKGGGKKARGGRAGGGRGDNGGAAVISELNRRALEENPTIDAGNEYIRQMLAGFDPSKYLNLYMSGGDLDADSEISRRIEDVYGTQFNRAMNDYLGVVGDEFDTSGVYSSSAHALERGETRGGFAQALNQAILDAQLGIRGQNIDLLESGMGFQSNLVSQIPALEDAEFIGLRDAAGVEMQQRAINMQGREIASRERIARLQASVQREGIAASRAAEAASQNRWDEAQAWEHEMQLTQMEREDEMNAWQYETGKSRQELDDYLRRTISIAGLGPERGTYAGSVGGSTAMGVLGGALTGAGLGEQFGLYDG